MNAGNPTHVDEIHLLARALVQFTLDAVRITGWRIVGFLATWPSLWTKNVKLAVVYCTVAELIAF